MDDTDWRWIDAGLASLSAERDPLRGDLLISGRLRLSLNDNGLDRIDLCSATLTSAAIERGQSTLFVLPDARPRRSALLFAYALLNVWWRTVSMRPRVLYCGASPGVRQQLSKLRVANIRLDSVFDQIDLPRGSRAQVPNLLTPTTQLPRVITAFAPADAKALVTTVRPRFIAVDFDDAGRLPWLEELLEAAKSLNTTVISWGTNPLSEVVGVFSRFGHVVRWPFGRSQGDNAEYGLDEQLEVLLQPYTVTQVHPLLADESDNAPYATSLRQASTKLRAIRASGALGYADTALQQHWKLYRDIEALHVPLDFFEAEAPAFWGLSRLSRTLSICKRFQEILAFRNPKTASDFSSVTDVLGDAVEWLSHNDPPLWAALAELVRTPPKRGYGRLITFQSRAKKTLFLFAMLAKLNLTEDDLRQLGNRIVTLDELRHNARESGALTETEKFSQQSKDIVFVPTLVGLPGIHLNQRLWPLFLADDVVLLAHSFQHGAISKKVNNWSEALSAGLTGLCGAIADLSPMPQPSSLPKLSSRVELSHATVFGVQDHPSSDIAARHQDALWNGPDIEDELGWLLDDDVETGPIERMPTDGVVPSDDYNAWIEEAVALSFTGGWCGTFEPTAKLNFIDRTTGQLEERYVRSLRIGDPVLIVPFQRRQGLYDIVVRRVHGHPAIQLHLALLDRWHSDLVRGFQTWLRSSRGPGARDRSLDVLLQELRAKGSLLSSTLTVRFWITGETLCPLDPEDIRRVAEILNLEFVASQYRRIGMAASRIRGLHRGLAIRLNCWLADQASEIDTSHDGEIIDEETQLTFGDIKASFVVTQIQAARQVGGPFLRSSLGMIARTGGL